MHHCSLCGARINILKQKQKQIFFFKIGKEVTLFELGQWAGFRPLRTQKKILRGFYFNEVW